MITRIKTYHLRKKAAKLEQEINDIADALPILRAAIINKRHEVIQLERKLQALGSMA